MNITNEYPVTIFKRDVEGKIFYNLGLSKKNQDGTYTNGYIMCRFKKDVELENKTKIYIKKGWLDFYLKDKVTVPYIFISEFETVKETIEKAKEEIEVPQNYKSEYEGIALSDADLPF